MTPPPGCVLEPHMYIPRTGARYWAYPGTGRLNNNWSNVSSPWKMFPSVSPTSFSISHGVRISACRMRSLKLGLTRDNGVDDGVAERLASRVVPLPVR